jgi:hypothetical protein
MFRTVRVPQESAREVIFVSQWLYNSRQETEAGRDWFLDFPLYSGQLEDSGSTYLTLGGIENSRRMVCTPLLSQSETIRFRVKMPKSMLKVFP